MRANGSIPNSPRWLWESIALWEARQALDPRSLPYMVALQPPPFSRIVTFDNSLIYDLDFTIAEFIVDRGGQGALRALLRNNGDTAATLGRSGSAFDAEWFAFVRGRYHF